ncbi:MAG TPA: hypothetical protein VKQ71_03095, partial [Acidimicrobiales bacterium]|nr:hypothetical protein [Acidimicrobiales bacterium]
ASFGKAVIAEAILMKSALHFFATLGPVGALAAGIAMVALGTALGGAARTSFAEGGVAGGAGSSSQPIHVIIVDTATRRASAVAQPSPIVFAPTIIGPNDVQAQAQLMEMVRQATRRNRPTGI